MSRTEDHTSGPGSTLHDNGRTVEPRRPKRRWRPEIERDRSMRAYQQNPRALRLLMSPNEIASRIEQGERFYS